MQSLPEIHHHGKLEKAQKPARLSPGLKSTAMRDLRCSAYLTNQRHLKHHLIIDCNYLQGDVRKLEKSQIREKVHIFYCKDNYPLRTLLKSTKDSPPEIKMHCTLKMHAAIPPLVTELQVRVLG